MRTIAIGSRSASAAGRLDARYFTAAGMVSAGTDQPRLGELATVWAPGRFTRAYAAPGEPGVPYLQPYDVFDYLPTAQECLSLARTKDLDRLVPAAGAILQTCSGRNLGPCAMADDILARFALSHDIIRIHIADPRLRHYVYAFLRTHPARHLLRQSVSGSVVDHLTTAVVESLPIPMVADPVRSEVIALTCRAIAGAAQARRRLDRLLRVRNTTLPPPTPTNLPRHGWSVPSRAVRDRLDAAYHHPLPRRCREQLAERGGVRLGELAEARLPARYKRHYVPPEEGRPILSGRQILQAYPVNLRHISDRSFQNPAEYELSMGMTVFGAVGRAEGRQGAPALVTPDRHGWLASNDVMRLVPRRGVRPGAVWLALACRQVRVQVNALSFGSMVDHLEPTAVEGVIVPVVEPDDAIEAEAAWESYARANEAQRRATDLIEAELLTTARS